MIKWTKQTTLKALSVDKTKKKDNFQKLHNCKQNETVAPQKQRHRFTNNYVIYMQTYNYIHVYWFHIGEQLDNSLIK